MKVKPLFKTIRSNPVAFLVSVTTCCAEMASQMFVFLWAPLFIFAERGRRSVYEVGIVYAAFVASYFFGLILFFSLVRRTRSSRLLLLSMASAFLIFLLANLELPLLRSDWMVARYEAVFLCMVIFEIAHGVYSPAMESLQAAVLQHRPQRSVLLALVRLPLTFFLSVAILVLFPASDGQFTLMIFIAVQLFFATLLSLFLDIVVKNRGYKQDPFRFPLVKTEVLSMENPI